MSGQSLLSGILPVCMPIIVYAVYASLVPILPSFSWPMPPLCLHNIQQPLGHPSPNMQTEIKQVKIHQTLKSGENFPESSRVWRAWKVDVLVFSLNNCLKITPTISNFPAILPETGSIIFQWPAEKNVAAKKMLGNSMEFTWKTAFLDDVIRIILEHNTLVAKVKKLQLPSHKSQVPLRHEFFKGHF